MPPAARIATFWDCGRLLLNSMEPAIPRHIRLTSHPGNAGEGMVKLRWGAATPEERGPVVASPAEPRHRNAIGSYSGAYAIYRALAVATRALAPHHRPDLTDTAPAALIGPHPQWTDPKTIVSLDPWGHLVGEVVRRVSGHSLGEFFAKEVAGPLGADFHIGLDPADDSRVAELIPPPAIADQVGELPEDSVARRTFINPVLDASVKADRAWRAAEIPAANGHGNARSVAAVQSVLAGGGQARGVRLLSEAGCNRVFLEQTNGDDLVLGVPIRFGMGYGLGSDLMPLGPRTGFWGGWGGSIIMVDLDLRIAVSYVMNRMQSGLVGDTRGLGVVQAAFTAAMAASA